MDTKNHPRRILMLPWLADGHVSPHLELGKKLVKRNFQVYLCSTHASLNPFRENLDGENVASSIQFIHIHLPLNSELSFENQTTRNLPSDLISSLITAFDKAKDYFHDIIREIKPHLVIYDFLQHWAPAVAEEENVPAVLFITGGAAAYSLLYHCSVRHDFDYPIPGLDLTRTEHQKAVMFLYFVTNGLMNKDRTRQAAEKSCNFILIRSLDGMEQKYTDYISILFKKEVISLGHFIRSPETNKSSDSPFIDWLGKRNPFSTVFVSFGTECSLSRVQVEELALGLEQSMVNFIWAIRFPLGENFTDLDEVLPEGYQNRVGERGLVVKGWAPQAKILSHPSVGGFVSHCGWNSALESIAFGVPIIGMPMNVDQPFNAMFLEGIGVALKVHREDGKFRKEEIANVVKEVVVFERGKKLRERINELRSKIDEKGEQEIDNVVKKLMQLVK